MSLLKNNKYGRKERIGDSINRRGGTVSGQRMIFNIEENQKNKESG